MNNINQNVADAVFGLVRAMGPVTTGQMVHEVLTQCVGPWDSVQDKETKRCFAGDAVLEAVNRLAKLGKIELYDIDGAWDLA